MDLCSLLLINLWHFLLYVDVLDARKTGKNKDVSDFDRDQIAKLGHLVIIISLLGVLYKTF